MTTASSRVLKVLLGIAGGLSAILASLFALMAYDLAQLPYNSEGRYYDGIVVHHDTAPFGWGILSALALSTSIALWWAARHVTRVSKQTVSGSSEKA